MARGYTGDLLVLADVFAHPGSSISEITARTGMPQSHVSETVARLRDQGTVESFPDPADRRRTLVRVSAEHPKKVMGAALVPVDAELTAALGDISPDEAADIIKTLETLATGAALLAAGIGVFLAGFTTHQPLISRAGVFVTGLAVVFAVLAVRVRHSRVRKNPGREAL